MEEKEQNVKTVTKNNGNKHKTLRNMVVINTTLLVHFKCQWYKYRN